LAGDAVDAVCQENRVIVHRRQAASHKNVFIQQITGCLIRGDLPGVGSKNLHARCVRCNLEPLRSPSLQS
ncbi:hypothetical protein V2I68_16355, partial [Pseudomonas viridiflava]|nr:hypothetical protein [Pseudomonas viridiflava]MEE3937126.1 hypothetical protein [Pseudomonas viridiflava]MEE3968574.1 hypothetical protein [Pseudomonas viridiflava]MEE3982730.1 hypothetical protein [Pseudomonas viridiflava]MEE3992324.1 hypothetical protein [Pseudomonas viridiflava]